MVWIGHVILCNFFHWYCPNTVPNLSFMLSEIYDVRKQISEYYELCESFQSNIQLEKGYPTVKRFHAFLNFIDSLSKLLIEMAKFTLFHQNSVHVSLNLQLSMSNNLFLDTGINGKFNNTKNKFPHWSNTLQKLQFSAKDFFSKCDQIRSVLRIWPYLLKNP